MSDRIADLEAVTIDCRDPETLAGFWSAVFGATVDSREGDPVQYIDLVAAGIPTIRLQRAPEPKTVKDRIHLDLSVSDLDVASARVEALGASRAADHDISEYGVTFRVMLDPEGNEFCLVVGNA